MVILKLVPFMCKKKLLRIIDPQTFQNQVVISVNSIILNCLMLYIPIYQLNILFAITVENKDTNFQNVTRNKEIRWKNQNLQDLIL